MYKLFRFRLYYQQLIRALVILHILIRHWRINWMSRSRFFRAFISRKYKLGGVIHTREERIRMILEELGPTFVKFGQILADRPDIVSEKLRKEFRKLQTQVKPFEHKVAFQLIERELGGDLKNFFKEIEPECIASASIGQVYKAILKNGKPVVVKVQRPDIEAKIKLDLMLMKFIAGRAAKEYPGFGAVDIVGFVDEFEITIKQEMDYINEASNAMRFGEMFRDVHYCKIPKVYLEMSTKKILVLEYVDGFRTHQLAEMREAGIEPKEIACNGTHILLKMILVHGFFQADPHPGNFFIQSGNRLAIVDFGMVGVLKPSHMNFLAEFTLGMASYNAKMVTSSLLTLCEKKFYPEREDLEFSIQEMLNRYGSLPYEKMNFSLMLNESIQIMLKYQLQLPGSIYLLLKSLATIEKFGYSLDPDISLPSIIQPYARDLVKKKFSLKAIANDLYDAAKDYAALIRDFPGEVNQILYRIKEGKIIHDLRVKDSSALSKTALSFGRILALAMIVGFMLTGSIIMTIWSKHEWIGNLMFATTSVVAIFVLLRLIFKTRM